MGSVRNAPLGIVLMETPLGPRHTVWEPPLYVNLGCVVWQSETVSVRSTLCNDISTCDTRNCVAPPLGIRLNWALRLQPHWTLQMGLKNCTLQALFGETLSHSWLRKLPAYFLTFLVALTGARHWTSCLASSVRTLATYLANTYFCGGKPQADVQKYNFTGKHFKNYAANKNHVFRRSTYNFHPQYGFVMFSFAYATFSPALKTIRILF
jgi:hypothetical protein